MRNQVHRHSFSCKGLTDDSSHIDVRRLVSSDLPPHCKRLQEPPRRFSRRLWQMVRYASYTDYRAHSFRWLILLVCRKGKNLGPGDHERSRSKALLTGFDASIRSADRSFQRPIYRTSRDCEDMVSCDHRFAHCCKGMSSRSHHMKLSGQISTNRLTLCALALCDAAYGHLKLALPQAQADHKPWLGLACGKTRSTQSITIPQACLLWKAVRHYLSAEKASSEPNSLVMYRTCFRCHVARFKSATMNLVYGKGPSKTRFHSVERSLEEMKPRMLAH